jgi:hypothetical protein
MMIGTLLFVPALAMGIAQQDPAQPAQPNQLQQDPATQSQPDSASQQNLQQDSAAQPGMEQEVVGTIEEVRDDSFSVKKDSDQSVVWFTITPELKSSYAAELVTGNHVRVNASAGDSPDRMAAVSVMAEAGDSTAAADTNDTSAADTQADLNADDTDVDADVDVDSDSATATLDTDTESDTQIAQTETDSSLRQDDAISDDTSDELPRTASSLPSVGALGLLALIGAAAVAFARKF